MATTRDYHAKLTNGDTVPLSLRDYEGYLKMSKYYHGLGGLLRLEFDPTDEKEVFLNLRHVVTASLGAGETLTEIGSRTFGNGFAVALYVTTGIVVPSTADLSSKTYRIEYASNGRTTVWNDAQTYLSSMPTLNTSQGQGFATIPSAHRNTYLETVDGNRILFAKSRNNRGRELFIANILSNAGSGTTVKLFEVA